MIKYIVLNDIHNIINKNKIIALYIFILLVYPLYLKLAIDYDFNNEFAVSILYSNLGASNDINSLIEFSMLMLNIGFMCWICIYLYTLNFNNSREFLYLRIPYSKWLISKILSISMSTIILSIISNLIVFIVYISLGMKISFINMIIIIVYISISRLILSYLCLFIFQLSKKYCFIMLMFMYVICAYIKNIDIVSIFSNNIFACNYINLSVGITVVLLPLLIYFFGINRQYKMFRRN